MTSAPENSRERGIKPFVFTFFLGCIQENVTQCCLMLSFLRCFFLFYYYFFILAKLAALWVNIGIFTGEVVQRSGAENVGLKQPLLFGFENNNFFHPKITRARLIQPIKCQFLTPFLGLALFSGTLSHVRVHVADAAMSSKGKSSIIALVVLLLSAPAARSHLHLFKTRMLLVGGRLSHYMFLFTFSKK